MTQEEAVREYQPTVRCPHCEKLKVMLWAAYDRIAEQSEALTRKAERQSIDDDAGLLPERQEEPNI